MMSGKILIIDKSFLHGIGRKKEEEFAEFVKNNFVILPEVLVYECATESDAKTRQLLLQRLGKAILSGASTCPAIGTIRDQESQRLQPYGALADLNETETLRGMFNQGVVSWSTDRANAMQQNTLNQAAMIRDTAKNIASTLKQLVPDTAKEAYKKLSSNNSIQERFKYWLKTAEAYGIHKIAVKTIPHPAGSSDKYCTTNEWVTWHWIRLISALSFELQYKAGIGGAKGDTNIEHDLQDIVYVLFLCRADGLLSGDKELVEPLAKVAFPEKHVFSDIS